MFFFSKFTLGLTVWLVLYLLMRRILIDEGLFVGLPISFFFLFPLDPWCFKIKIYNEHHCFHDLFSELGRNTGPVFHLASQF